MERERGGPEESVGEEAVEGQDLHLHVLVTVDRRRYRPREPLRGGRTIKVSESYSYIL